MAPRGTPQRTHSWRRTRESVNCVRMIVAVMLGGMVTGRALLAATPGPEGLVGLEVRPGPEGLTGLEDGQVWHGFTARASFMGLAGKPMGARFVHRTGVVVDVLFFASVPQVSILVPSVPVSDSGEPHALEHVLVFRGLAGRSLQMLKSMRLATLTATTYRHTTIYQFRTSGGSEAFYELLGQYLAALMQPDFTDEEARREVAHLEVETAADGRLTLTEKGAVFNEMAGSMTRPSYVLPRMLRTMAFGEDHPLSRNAGGNPARLWEVTPEAIRSFHRANYRIGPGLSVVAALPFTWSAHDFLRRLDPLLVRLAPPEAAEPPALPPFRPAPLGQIRIGTYPSDSPDAPQDVLLGWRALPDLTSDEWDALEILLAVIGDGESSYLHHDLVDQKTRSFDSGLTGVASTLVYETVTHPYLTLGGLPASLLEEGHIERLRGAAMERIRWIAELADGSPELTGLASKTLARLAASRRQYLKFVDSPPRFGDPGADLRWHDRLGRVARATGFEKALAPLSLYERLEHDLGAGRNPWRAVVRRAGLTDPPYVVALRPDPSLAERERKDAATRLKRQESQIAERLGGGDVQVGLAKFRAEQEAATAALEARDRALPKPKFVANPPLTLDDAAFTESKLAGRVPLVQVYFPTTPFTDVAVAFDLSGVAAEDWMLLPLLAGAISRTGVRTAAGEVLDYAKAQERRDAEIYAFSVAPIGNPAYRRHELEVMASASSVDEIGRAVDWMENHILRPDLGSGARPRLIDLAKEEIQSLRRVMETREYTWAPGLAADFEYQDDPIYLAVSSIFTKLRLITRVRWRLEDPSPEAKREIFSHLAAVERLLVAAADQLAVLKRLESVPGELGETLRYEFSMLPADRWRQDLTDLINELHADIDVGSAEVLEGFERLRRHLFVQEAARARVTANPANAKAVAAHLEALLAKLPVRRAPVTPMSWFPLVQARLEERYGPLPRPVHVGFPRPGAKAGVHVVFAPGPSYKSRSRSDVLDLLAVGVFSGVGPQAFFMKTTGAGLAYNAGIVARLRHGRILHYADSCPDLVQTMKFVSRVAANQSLEDPFLLQYSLADAFADFRGAGDFSSRGAALAANLADGVTPETVAALKRLVLEAVNQKQSLDRVRERLPDAVGRVVVGYGTKVSASPGAVAFVIGPEEMLARYETFLKENGEADRLVRLYPRDFWPRSAAAVRSSATGDLSEGTYNSCGGN